MDQIFKIKDAVVNYLSPVAKRRRTMGGPQTPGYIEFDGEHQFLSEPQNNRRSLNFAYDRMNQNYISKEDRTTPTRNPLKRPRENDEIEEPVFSGDDTSPKQASSHNVTESGEESETPDYMDEGEDEEEEEDLISAQQKVDEYLAKQAAEFAMAKETVERARADGEWSQEELFLLERLQYMGHEGLLPHWAKERNFRTVPEAMFCLDDNALLGESSKSIQMLEFLVHYLPRRVHDRYYGGSGPPEAQMRQWIGKYVEWTERDGGYYKKKFIPVLCLVEGRWRAPAAETTKRLKDQMNFHAESWRRTLLRPSPIVNEFGETEIYFRRPPLIYGILYIQAKALFVTLDSSDPQAKIRDIHVCDFLDTSKHFWHAISVAIVAKIAQKYMMSIVDTLEDDDPPEPDSCSENELESARAREKRLQKEAKMLEREKERQRQEDLSRLEQQMNEIKMEEEEDNVMESIEEYERVEIVEGEEEEQEDFEDDRPSMSEYDEEEEEEMEVEVDEDEDENENENGEQSADEELISDEDIEDAEDDVEEEDEPDDSNVSNESDNENFEVVNHYGTGRTPRSASSDEL
ncbi:hypothetical protein BELL_0521g00060 [Botrytis elliptica]|uniref:Uncharacterized protein n=1 Tax=Botrytis elliptica TaxID=278938 RepID=A0A4Z1JE64_9HELO|nr:hypothetical protein EAE99_006561 [Botrytis elliptica]TGO71858.1 hypothetical protein BELL_0521g00060 [Botrytis elliptica]